MNRFFLRHEAYITQEANIPFFSLLTFFGASFYYLLLLLCFDIAFSFTLCLLLLFYTFAVHSYYYSYSSLSYYVKGMILTRVTKKRGQFYKRKAAPITFKYKKYVSNRIIHLIVGTCRQLETRNALRICYTIFYAIKSRVSLHFCHCQ